VLNYISETKRTISVTVKRNNWISKYLNSKFGKYPGKLSDLLCSEKVHYARILTTVKLFLTLKSKYSM
jgi:hypothetical protein